MLVLIVFILFPILAVACIVYFGKKNNIPKSKIMLKALGTVVFFVLFYAITSYVFLHSFVAARKLDKQLDKFFDEAYASVIFEGNVRNIHEVKHLGRRYVFLCVDITKTNTPDFYRFDDQMALQIKEGTAVVPVGLVSQKYLRRFSYVKVNENHNKLIILYGGNGDADTLVLDYCHGGISEQNMNLCDCE